MLEAAGRAFEEVVYLVVAQVLLEIANVSIGINRHKFNAGNLRKIFQMLARDRVAVTGVMRAARVDPCGAGDLEVRLTLPDRAGDGKFRQRPRRFDGSDFIHDEAETIAEIDEAGIERLAGGRVENHANRVSFSADAQRMNLHGWFSRGNRGADF